MSSHNYAVAPRWIFMGGTRVSAEIQRDQPNRRWCVIVMFSRTPNQAPIHGREVDAQFIDDQDTALHVMERPPGPLVESAEALQVSAEAPFQFQDSEHAPGQLLVTYQGQVAQFRIVSRDKLGSSATE